MQPQSFAGTGAQCALHPERTAAGTCTRCGNFVCSECAPLCPTCRQLVGGEGFPYRRDNFNFDSIWGFAFERWKQEWVMLSICVLILIGVGFAVGLFNAAFQGVARAIVGDRGGSAGTFFVAFLATFTSQIVATLVQGIFQMGLYRVLIDVLTGRKADVARMMTQFPKLGRYILQMLIIGVVAIVPLMLYLGVLAVVAASASGISLSNLEHLDRDFRPIAGIILGLGLLALIPVAIYVALPLTFATMELVYGDAQPLDSIRRAYQLANGFRLNIFGYAFIGGLVAIVGVLACCIGALPAVALGQMLLVGLYLALRNGSGLPPPIDP